MKKVVGVYSAPRGHWVGDGFPVRSLFSYNTHGEILSPFLLLDRAGPMDFAPTDKPHGVGQHPHRGFETVTIVYAGEVAHRDSTGEGGVIGPGDVQWMTAAAGIVHEEFHSAHFSQTGGTLDMVQLWVNLPARYKMSRPAYQGITRGDIPVVALADSGGSVRVIAGQYGGAQGPAHTFSPMEVLDVQLAQGTLLDIPAREGWTTAVVVLSGAVVVNGAVGSHAADLIVLEQDGVGLQIESRQASHVLVLMGEPLGEPVVGHGPFVMNTAQEINQAVSDFTGGKFGQIAR
jgi:redox-sensitive bicupin YhaK (pirin superfamily)